MGEKIGTLRIKMSRIKHLRQNMKGQGTQEAGRSPHINVQSY